MALFGSQAGGAVLWGLLAGPLGLVATFLLAAALMVVGAATMRWWPLLDTTGLDRSHVVYWPEPQLVVEPDPQSGPVVVTSTYTVAPAAEAPFLQAMIGVRLSRLRTGAIQWGLYRDGETSHRFVEVFVVASWEEHLRQHRERLTGADRQLEDQAQSFSVPPPHTTHLIPSMTLYGNDACPAPGQAPSSSAALSETSQRALA
jgi:hypothetical protein